MLSIGILGTGAIGSLMAYHWRQQQLFALPRQRHSTSISVLPQALGRPLWHAKLPYWQGQPLNWLVVCTKAADTLPALQAWQTQLSQVGNLLLIQNGMGQQQQVAEWLKQQGLALPLWAGMCTEGAFRQNSTVVYAGVGKTLVGLWPSLPSSQPLPKPLEYSADISAALKQKLAINAVINPLTGLLKCRNGELLSNPLYREQLLALCAEISELYQALGWSLSQPLAEHAQQVAQATAQNKSSTLQDIEAGRNTELAYITGFLLEQAQAIGYSVPLSRELYRALSH